MTIRGLATINLLYTNLFSFFVVTVAPGSAADWPNLWLVRKGAITNMMSWVKRFLENQEILSRTNETLRHPGNGLWHIGNTLQLAGNTIRHNGKNPEFFFLAAKKLTLATMIYFLAPNKLVLETWNYFLGPRNGFLKPSK